jgi:hypothetical protein
LERGLGSAPFLSFPDDTGDQTELFFPRMRVFRTAPFLLAMATLPVGTVSGEGPASVFLAEGTVEYVPGGLPLVIAAPHGGRLDPDDIPDRASGVTTRDADTDLLARELAEAVARRAGTWPHLVICHLRRSKVDCNRDALVAAGGNPKALATWRAFHEAIARARAAAGRGLFLDLHGHSHPEGRVELGYLLGEEQLLERGPAFESLAPVSSLAALLRTSPGSFEELVRGPTSLGGLLEAAGYSSVPSPRFPDPGGAAYFRGGYNTARYRASREGEAWFSLQVECPRPGVRDSPESRLRFAEALATALGTFLEHHAGLRLAPPPGSE